MASNGIRRFEFVPLGEFAGPAIRAMLLPPDVDYGPAQLISINANGEFSRTWIFFEDADDVEQVARQLLDQHGIRVPLEVFLSGPARWDAGPT